MYPVANILTVTRLAMLHRAANLAQLDQKEMLSVREAWFEEVGGPPTGNKRELISS